MDKEQLMIPNYLFEVSWEVCNKVGGIYTVVSTKAYTLTQQLRDKYIAIGPDFNRDEMNVDFEEDVNLLKGWKRSAYREGLRVRTGRWKIKGSPLVILVDFSSFLPQKDELLGKFWEDYKVDSISGQWDYIEPVLFGYAAGKVIESFVRNYRCLPTDRIVAHFHEWMTASGGLYLKSVLPGVANVFTAHATVMGRAIAGNGLQLYGDMEKFNVDELAQRFNVMAKHSIERAGAREADSFTTVSEITSVECRHMLGRTPDVITPNGFEEEIVWKEPVLSQKRKEARDLFLKIAEVSLGKKFESEPLIVGTSGRYEFRNKGLDEFIDALAALNRNEMLSREILAYILVPGWNHGPRKDLQAYLHGGDFHSDPFAIKNVTHYMGDSENDAVLKKLRQTGLLNDASGKVSVMFVPAYLNGVDGIFDKHYYELLPGFDLTLFPSYYEPWGYTPLESIAFGVPSVTSSLAGFGRWVIAHSENHECVSVIERNDYTGAPVQEQLVDVMLEYAALDPDSLNRRRQEAQELSKSALWKNLIGNYYQAYSDALHVAAGREQERLYNGGEIHEQANFVKQRLVANAPSWTRVMIERRLPERLHALEELSRNLWWSWIQEARALFESIDLELWNEVDRNPIALLDNLSADQFEKLEKDADFLARMDAVYAQFREYMARKSDAKGPRIAYFSMEYGLHSSLKIYSGGLGILAGDYLKEASDQNIPMKAVGLLYRYGYFTQKLSANGEQEATYEPQNFYKLPITPERDEHGNWKSIVLHYPGRDVTARIWRCDVGRTELYLLDTDHDLNLEEDRSITHYLYGGDWENRLKQEILLGMGGIKALTALGVQADVFHCNEGHAAFIGIRRIQDLIARYGLSFSEALEVVRSSSLFTTHTPVPAGHDAFPESMIRQYMSRVPEALKITWEQFINLGKVNPNDPNEKFSMSFLACNLSQEVNGVSKLHGEVSKEILGGLWPGYFKEELHIGYVTNGVHFPTWAASNLHHIYQKAFGPAFEKSDYDVSIWQGIRNVPDEELWDARLHLKKKLIDYIRRRLSNPESFRFNAPGDIVKVAESLDPHKLTIGFARRFATYKRAYLLFSNLDRLDRIVNNPDRPVQFLFAGKAHPNDKPGQDLIKRIVEVSSMPQFVGKVLFIPNYDMHLARRMVQGVDVWMNTPTRPLEASGTSGEKAVMNGVLHFSVLDGWWVEGYRKNGGWMLPEKQTFADQRLQDELDAETIYSIIEEEIVPAYYNRTEDGVSHQWVGYMKNSIADIASRFTTKRMIEDYQRQYYAPLHERNRKLVADDFREAREIAFWKRCVSKLWDDNVFILEARTLDVGKEAIVTGHVYKTQAVVSLGHLTSDDIGVELVIMRQQAANNEMKFFESQPMHMLKVENNIGYYELELEPNMTGSYDVAVRVYAKNEKLPNRMDFALVKWS